MSTSTGNPFVGLRPFESEESLLFFGRQQQAMDLLQRLHKHHFVAVTGSSGSGKSSLIKAGLIPRLKAGFLVDDKDRWVIASAKPGQSPLCNLLDGILAQISSTQQLSSTVLQEQIKVEGVDVILNMLQSLWNNKTNFFLLIDQFEELFRFSLAEKDINKKDEAIDFVNILLQLADRTDLPIYIVITMRSDFIGDCAEFYGLPEAMNKSQYIVPRLNRIQLETTIEAPARLYNTKIDPALTAKLLNDAQRVKDELPLLQHALMRLWDHKKINDPEGHLTIDDYKSIGGIEKALCNHADEALKGMTDTELKLTKKIFQALTGIDENGRKIRRPVHLSELQVLTGVSKETLLNIINRFNEDGRSFLIINRSADNNDLLIDISHESLIRQWSTLSYWVDEEAESAKFFLRLTEAATLYKQQKKDLLSGNELQQFLDWYKNANPDKDWALRYNTSFNDNLIYLNRSKKEYTRQQSLKRRTRRLFIGGLTFIIVVISAFAFFIYKNYLDNKNALALNFLKSSQYAKAENNFLNGLHLIAEAAVITNDKDLVKNLFVDAEAFLPHVILDTIYQQDDIINSVSFSADGRYILAAGNNYSARLFDKTTGRQIGSAMTHALPVNGAAFSADDKLIVTCSNDKTAQIWQTSNGKLLHTFIHNDHVISAVFSADMTKILTGSSDGYVRLWLIDSEKAIDSIQQNSTVLNAVFSPDDKTVLISCSEATPYLWNFSVKKEHAFIPDSLQNAEAIVNAIFNSDGSKILTMSKDSFVRVWDTKGNVLAALQHSDRITDAAFSPNGKWIATASDDKIVRLWDLANQKQAGAAMKHDGPVYSVCFSNDSKQILTAGSDKIIRLWDVAPVEVDNKKNILRHKGIIKSAVFNNDGTKILTAGADSIARLWNRINNQQIQAFKHSGNINSAVFTHDYLQIITASDDSTVRMSEVATGKTIINLNFNEKINKAIPDKYNKRLLIAGNDGNVMLWDISTQPAALLDSFKFEDAVNDAAFSPDEKLILIAAGNAAYILNASSGNIIQTFKHDEQVSSAVFNHNGTKVITASWDGTARLWNAVTGQQTGPAMLHALGVSSAAFSHDEKWIVTSGFDKEIHLWNSITLKEIGLGTKYAAALNSAVFSPDDRWILTAGYDSTAQINEIKGDLDLPPALFKLQAKTITGMEYNTSTSETQSLTLQDWINLKKKFLQQAEQHFKVCKYPGFNFWKRFHNSESPAKK